MNPFSLLHTRLAHYPTIHRAAAATNARILDGQRLHYTSEDPRDVSEAIEVYAIAQPYGLPLVAASELLPMIGEGHGAFDDGTPYFVPFVACLPFGRGWLAGCGSQPIEDDGTALHLIERETYPTAQRAAMAADSLAEREWRYLMEE